MTITELVNTAYTNAKERGFYDSFQDGQFIHGEDMRNHFIASQLMLIVGEVAEALEALKNEDAENFREELADVVIRVCSLAGLMQIDLEREIEAKVEYNKGRGYKHGKCM